MLFELMKFAFTSSIIICFVSSTGLGNELPDSSPEFGEPMQNITVSVGQDAKLACIVNNLGRYKVAWSHLGSETLLAIHNRIITINNRFSVLHNGFRTWWLHIRNVKPRDRGWYMCQINTSPMIRQSGFIHVREPPQIIEKLSSKDIEVHEGEDVNLRCAAIGHPRPSVSWEREDDKYIKAEKKKQMVFEGQDLNFTKVSRTDMGAYLCIAANGVPPSVSKRIILSVSFQPTVQVPNHVLGALRRTDITLECNVEAFPKPMMYWAKKKLLSPTASRIPRLDDEETMLVSSTKYSTFVQQKHSYGYSMRIIINDLRSEDFGTYFCHIKSSYGENKASIKLYEIQSPSINPKRMQSMKGGRESAVLTFNGLLDADETDNSGVQRHLSITTVIYFAVASLIF